MKKNNAYELTPPRIEVKELSKTLKKIKEDSPAKEYRKGSPYVSHYESTLQSYQQSDRMWQSVIKRKSIPNKKGMSWKARGQYIEDELARAGEQSLSFNALNEGVSVASTLDQWQKNGDRMYHNFFLSPEAGEEIDLQDYTRRLMKAFEDKVGVELEWVAGAPHYNTSEPHVHIAMRGVDKAGNTLHFNEQLLRSLPLLARDVLTDMRGLKLDSDIERMLDRKTQKLEFLPIDKTLQAYAVESGFVIPDKGISLANRRSINARLEFYQQQGWISKPSNHSNEYLFQASHDTQSIQNSLHQLEKHTFGLSLKRQFDLKDKPLSFINESQLKIEQGMLITGGIHPKAATPFYVLEKDNQYLVIENAHRLHRARGQGEHAPQMNIPVSLRGTHQQRAGQSFLQIAVNHNPDDFHYEKQLAEMEHPTQTQIARTLLTQHLPAEDLKQFELRMKSQRLTLKEQKDPYISKLSESLLPQTPPVQKVKTLVLQQSIPLGLIAQGMQNQAAYTIPGYQKEAKVVKEQTRFLVNFQQDLTDKNFSRVIETDPRMNKSAQEQALLLRKADNLVELKQVAQLKKASLSDAMALSILKPELQDHFTQFKNNPELENIRHYMKTGEYQPLMQDVGHFLYRENLNKGLIEQEHPFKQGLHSLLNKKEAHPAYPYQIEPRELMKADVMTTLLENQPSLPVHIQEMIASKSVLLGRALDLQHPELTPILHKAIEGQYRVNPAVLNRLEDKPELSGALFYQMTAQHQKSMIEKYQSTEQDKLIQAINQAKPLNLAIEDRQKNRDLIQFYSKVQSGMTITPGLSQPELIQQGFILQPELYAQALEAQELDKQVISNLALQAILYQPENYAHLPSGLLQDREFVLQAMTIPEARTYVLDKSAEVLTHQDVLNSVKQGGLFKGQWEEVKLSERAEMLAAHSQYYVLPVLTENLIQTQWLKDYLKEGGTPEIFEQCSQALFTKSFIEECKEEGITSIMHSYSKWEPDLIRENLEMIASTPGINSRLAATFLEPEDRTLAILFSQNDPQFNPKGFESVPEVWLNKISHEAYHIKAVPEAIKTPEFTGQAYLANEDVLKVEKTLLKPIQNYLAEKAVELRESNSEHSTGLNTSIIKEKTRDALVREVLEKEMELTQSYSQKLHYEQLLTGHPPLTEQEKNNPDFIRQAIHFYPSAMKMASQQLKNDREFVEASLTQSPEIYPYIGKVLQEDIQLSAKALAGDFHNHIYISPEIQTEKAFWDKYNHYVQENTHQNLTLSKEQFNVLGKLAMNGELINSFSIETHNNQTVLVSKDKSLQMQLPHTKTTGELQLKKDDDSGGFKLTNANATIKLKTDNQLDL